MESLNYFLYMHQIIIFVGTVLTTFFLLCVIGYLFVRFSKRSEFINKRMRLILAAIILLSIFGTFVGLGKLRDPFDIGGIKDIYILDNNNQTQITLQMIRIHSKRFGASYDLRLTSYDLATGKSIGTAEMLKKHYNYDYSIYKSSGKDAWGYSKKTGIQYLDLLIPKVVSQKEFFSLNPQMEKATSMTSSEEAIDPNSQTWCFDNVHGSLGYYAHAKNFSLSAKSVTLLKPKFIRELNQNILIKDKTWIAHQSAMYKDSDLLISFLNGSGEMLNEINLSKCFDNKKIKIIATYTTKDNIYLFITAGDTHLASVYGFTLVALKTDANTGEVIDEIHYF